MKKLFILLILLLIPLTTLGAQINAPKDIAKDSVLFINVELSPPSDNLEVKIDGTNIVTLSSTLFVSVNSPFVLSSFVFDQDKDIANGTQLYIAYAGLGEGTHIIKIEDNNTILDKKEVFVYTREEMERKIRSVKATSLELLNEDIQTQKDLNKMREEIISIQTSIDELKGMKEQIAKLSKEKEIVEEQIANIEENNEDSLREETSLVTGINSQNEYPPQSLDFSILVLPILGLIGVIIAIIAYLNKEKLVDFTTNIQKKEDRIDDSFDIKKDNLETKTKKWERLPQEPANKDEEFRLQDLMKRD